FEAADPVVVGVTEGEVVRFVPAGAETEDEAAAADLVDRVGDLRLEGRVAVRGAGDERTELDARRDRRQGRQVRPALPGTLLLLPREPVDQVIRHPERIESAHLRPPR